MKPWNRQVALLNVKQHSVEGWVTSRALAAGLGISRQAASAQLTRLAAEGFLHREGAGRSTGYRLAQPASTSSPLRTYRRAGLSEDDVWRDALEQFPGLQALPQDAEHAFHYAFTEMVNNAIDHSDAETVGIWFTTLDRGLAFEVHDDGIGIFARVQEARGLASPLEALQDLTKGKVTTMPERHTGEGLFFTSKVADYFEVESGNLCWIVDNRLQDVGIAVGHREKGTRVRFEADPSRARQLPQLFAEYTKDLAFAKTRTYVKLYESGTTFISRSEAKRLLAGAEKFEEVVLDFKGVEAVGQGFADEVFRVWQHAHPTVVLQPIAMVEPVAFMIERARRPMES